MDWFHKSVMDANLSNLQFMLMKSSTRNEKILTFNEINDRRIKRETQVTFLGISIDENLKFDKHIDLLCKKEV